MDAVAEDLGIDSVELRRTNGCTPGYEGPTALKVMRKDNLHCKARGDHTGYPV